MFKMCKTQSRIKSNLKLNLIRLIQQIWAQLKQSSAYSPKNKESCGLQLCGLIQNRFKPKVKDSNGF